MVKGNSETQHTTTCQTRAHEVSPYRVIPVDPDSKGGVKSPGYGAQLFFVRVLNRSRSVLVNECGLDSRSDAGGWEEGSISLGGRGFPIAS